MSRPDSRRIMSRSSVVDGAFKKTSPNYILIIGTLEDGVTSSNTSFKSELPVAGGHALLWCITGTEGEIELTSPESGWQIGHPEAKFTLKLGKDREPQKVELEALDPAIGSLGDGAEHRSDL